MLNLNQTKGALSLGVVLGLGMLRSKLPWGSVLCYTSMELMTVLGLWAEGSSETISAVLALKHLFLVLSYLRLAVRDSSWKSGLKLFGFFNFDL